MQSPVQEHRGDLGGRHQVLQVAVRAGQLLDLALHLLVDGGKLLVDRLEFLAAGFEFLARGAQLLVHGLQLFVGSLEFLLVGVGLLDGVAQGGLSIAPARFSNSRTAWFRFPGRQPCACRTRPARTVPAPLKTTSKTPPLPATATARRAGPSTRRCAVDLHRHAWVSVDLAGLRRAVRAPRAVRRAKRGGRAAADSSRQLAVAELLHEPCPRGPRGAAARAPRVDDHRGRAEPLDDGCPGVHGPPHGRRLLPRLARAAKHRARGGGGSHRRPPAGRDFPPFLVDGRRSLGLVAEAPGKDRAAAGDAPWRAGCRARCFLSVHG